MLRLGVILVLAAILLVPFTWVLWGRGYNPAAGLIWSLENRMELVFREDRYEEQAVPADERKLAELDTMDLGEANKRLLRKYAYGERTQRVLVSPERTMPMRYVVAVALVVLGVGVYCWVWPLVGRRGTA